MTMLRVLMTKKFFEQDIDYLRAGLAPNIELIAPPAFTPAAIADSVQDNIHVLLGDQVTKDILEHARRTLRLIQIPWTGVDRLDFTLLQQYPFPICNSHSNAAAVAEMAVGLMLAITKKIPLHDARLREGRWMRPQHGVPHSHFPPTTIKGRTVGFIGFGAIARQIAGLLSGFSVRCLATDAHPTDTPPTFLEAIYPPEANHTIAAQCDIIFITVPLLPATRGMIDAAFFAQMQPSSYLINTSRGEVVDEEALYTALATRQITGAALDTWYQYPSAAQPEVLPSARFPFHTLDNMVLSPHRAGFAEDDLPHLADVVENLNRLAGGKPLINKVDITVGF